MATFTPLRWHVLFVFLSSATIVLAFVLETKPLFESARPKPAVLAARWCLWLGTAGLLVTVLTGFLQPEKSVMFQNNSNPFVEHRFLGIWTAFVFLGISVWHHLAGRRSSALLVLVWLSALWILGAQIHGGYRWGSADVFEKGDLDGEQ